MPIASSVSLARFIAASLLLLGVGRLGSGWSDGVAVPALRCLTRAAPEVFEAPGAPGGPYRQLEFSSTRVQSLDLPPWFGEAGLPRAGIAGRVVGATPNMTVRLAMNVPEPGIWPGRVVSVQADGSFDFGPMRAGPYQVIAYGGGQVTRWTPVDTSTGAGNYVELFAAPCQRVHGSFWAAPDRATMNASPAVGVAVDLAGWIVGVTDARGAYEVCVPALSDDAKLRVAGFADPPRGYRTDGHGHRLLRSERPEVGSIRGAGGAPVVQVGVQPIWRTGAEVSDCHESGSLALTDGEGRFSYNGAYRLCGFRIWNRSTTKLVLHEGLRLAPQVARLSFAGDDLFDRATEPLVAPPCGGRDCLSPSY